MEFHNSSRFSESGPKTVLVNVDETICFYSGVAEPNRENIAKINRLHDSGWNVIYWTTRQA